MKASLTNPVLYCIYRVVDIELGGLDSSRFTKCYMALNSVLNLISFSLKCLKYGFRSKKENNGILF